MKNIVYHGSPNGNIKELKANKSTHKIECIYATDNIAIAKLFMGRGRGDLDFVIGTDDDIPYIVERREGVLKETYNKEGYLYEMDGTTFEHYDFLWSPEVISKEKSIKINNCIYYPNILEELKEEVKRGNLIIYEYPNRPKKVPLDNSDLINKYIEFENKGHKGAIDNLLMVYPELRERVFSKLEMPTEFYYIDRKVDNFDQIIVSDNFQDTLLRNDSPVFVREEGWINYDVVDSKLIFEKGGFNFDEDFYIYKVKGTAKRLSGHYFSLDNVQIVSSERIDLNNYLARKSLTR